MSTPVKPRKITEDILLNLKTRRCRVTCSEATAQTDISWDDYLELCFEKELIYYVDLESFRQEMQLDNIIGYMKKDGVFVFQCRVNSGSDFEWITVSAVVAEKSGDEITRLRITAESQNIYSLNVRDTDDEIIREMLFKGFGKVYSNTIWIDVLADRYLVQNLYGDECYEEMTAKPTGFYTHDNLCYAAKSMKRSG